MTARPQPDRAEACGVAVTGLGIGLGSGQAETLRAPAGHQDCLRLGEDWVEMENDDAELADMWPAGHRRRRLHDRSRAVRARPKVRGQP
ncbi:hypothetical protein [Brachybacterium sp. P6-10-X1]|uniref:hypothetical protein n=1 Tax=Brachybacterium sp. P6-10-X1 TaxID=1903186 RepID=UPI0012FA8DE8|nr:hypothetical protein [Brachybacterium sp. P6-10-X1]